MHPVARKNIKRRKLNESSGSDGDVKNKKKAKVDAEESGGSAGLASVKEESAEEDMDTEVKVKDEVKVKKDVKDKKVKEEVEVKEEVKEEKKDKKMDGVKEEVKEEKEESEVKEEVKSETEDKSGGMSSTPYDVIWCLKTLSTFVQVMACHLCGDKPLPEIMMTYLLIHFAQKGQHFSHSSCKCIFFNANFCVLIQMLLKFVCQQQSAKSEHWYR